jgi:hypothetical protein
MRLVIKEELLDDVCLVAQAQDEVLVAELAVVVHQMPKDRLVSDQDRFGMLSDTSLMRVPRPPQNKTVFMPWGVPL